MAITGYHSVSGYCAYAKPNSNHKREALSGIINQLDRLLLLSASDTTCVKYFSIF